MEVQTKAYEETRQRHLAFFASLVPEHLGRLRWSADALANERQERLRALLRVALERSPWHRARLRGLDVERFREENLAQLPAMTKTDLMENWDAIVTEPRLTLERTERHVASLRSDAYLADEFHAVASGGSSGQRAVFAFGWEPWALAFIGAPRMGIWDRITSPELAPLPDTRAVVAAQDASHMTSAMSQTFARPDMQIERLPVTMPLHQIVAGLQELQPTTLIGYASALVLLAAEARAGRLRIAPKRLASTSEPLLPEARTAIEEAFGAPIANTWGASEVGAMATGCWRSSGMHLCDDLVIFEPVDRNGEAVPPGTCSEKVLVTSIANPTLPLIRYEITDQMTFLSEPCPCGSAHRRIGDVAGRLDDVFRYEGGVAVHPHVFRSPLSREVGVVEYQVRQTPRGAEILALGAIADPSGVERALETELTRLGIEAASVALRCVDRLQRQASGKMRRFVPLPSAAQDEVES